MHKSYPKPNKKFIFYTVFLFCCCLYFTGNALSQTVISLGSGTTVSTTSGLTGISTTNDDSRVQYLIRASEIIAAGGHAGNLTSVSLYITAQPGRNISNFNIKMKHTTATVTTTTFETGATILYERNIEYAMNLPADSWRSFRFDTPFCWDGTRNIILEICFDNSANTAGGGLRVYAPGYNSSVYRVTNGGTAGCSLTTGASISTSRPQMKFEIEPPVPVSITVNTPSCASVSNSATNTISFSNVVTSSCPPSSTFEYSINNGASWSSSPTFNNLSPGVYNWAVRFAGYSSSLTGTAGISEVPVLSGPANVCVGSSINIEGTGEWSTSSLPTGGLISVVGGERVHIFTTSGTFTNNTGSNVYNAKVLVVGGGGGGGRRHAGGGGGGGLIYRTGVGVPNGSHTISIGAGGAGGSSFSGVNIGGKGTDGDPSSFGTLFTAYGGGGGGGNENGPGNNGGSGGGGSNATSGGAGFFGQGFKGGNHTINHASGCGGGGAGGAAVNSTSGSPGGPGVTLDISGNATTYAGGGGGGTNIATGSAGGIGGGGIGGNGGGGDGSTYLASRKGGDGIINTGGGGGGGGAYNGTANADNSGLGGSGGSGIVIVRYAFPAYTSSNPAIASVDPVTGTVTGIQSGTVTITYTTPAGCIATHQVTVNAPAGNPSSFGSNQWNVYAYEGNDPVLTANAYKGYYIQPNLDGGNEGINTSQFWENVNSPSYAGTTLNSGNLWNGCLVGVDNHTFVHKRKGFPCGTYKIKMQEWDDNVKVILNGTVVWSCGQWSGNNAGNFTAFGTSATSCTSIDPGTNYTLNPTSTILRIGGSDFIKLDAQSELEIQTFEFVGGSNLKMDIIPSMTTLSTLGTNSRMCPVSGTSFIDFVDDYGNLIASVNPNGNNLGSVTLTSYVDNDAATMFACNMPANPLYETAYMGRRWVIRATTAPTSAVSLRLPFNNSELTQLTAKANATTANLYDQITDRSSLTLSKYSGAIEDGSPVNNCGGGTTITVSQTGGGILSTIYPSISNAQYVTFNVNSFSELYLHGSSNASPLPVNLTHLSANCHTKMVLNWSTASEQNSLQFVVQKSRDMETWVFVQQIQAAGNSNTNMDYHIEDEHPFNGIAYYRLVQIDNDGVEKIYGPISTICSGISNSISVAPNPTQGSFTAEIFSLEVMPGTNIQLLDLTGKIIHERTLNITEGHNQILFNNMALTTGTYLLNVQTKKHLFNPIKIIMD